MARRIIKTAANATATLADTEWTDTALDGDPVVTVTSFEITNNSTVNELQFRFGTAGDRYTVPANTTANAQWWMDLKEGDEFTFDTNNKLMVKATTASVTYSIHYLTVNN